MKKTLALILLLAGLTLDAQGENRIRIWSPQVNYIWKHGGSNWSNLVGKRDEYRDGDTVMFGSLPNGTVELMGTLTPASVLVDNDTGSDYIFSGDGSLDGNMQLTKSGDGTLTIYNSNTYEGGTKIEGGKIVIGNDDALGSGHVTLGSKGDAAATLDLNEHSISNKITLEGSASIGNGTLNGDVSMGSSAKITLTGDLSGKGKIYQGGGATVDLNNHSISNPIFQQGAVSMGNGTLTNTLTMRDYSALYLHGDLTCKGKIYVDINTPEVTINLNDNTLNSEITIEFTETFGCVFIEGGTYNGDVYVMNNMDLHMAPDLSGTGTIILSGVSRLYMGLGTYGQVKDRNLVVLGTGGMYDGTFYGDVSVGDYACLDLNTSSIEGTITLAEQAILNLRGCTISASVTLENDRILTQELSAKIGNGTLNGFITVGEKQTLTLIGDLDGTGSISLGDNATLNLDTHTLSKGVTLTGYSAQIGNGKLNGSLSVAYGQSLTLLGDLYVESSISLGDDTTLDLNNHTLDTSVSLTGNARIGGGEFNGSLEVGADNMLSLLGELYGKGKISLGNNAVLELSGSTLSNSVSLAGDSAQIGGGTFNGSLEVGANKKLTLSGYLGGEGKISLGDNASLDLDDQPLSGNVTLTGSNATISNGTVKGTLTAKQGASARLSGATIEAGATNVKSLDGAKPGLLQEISVSDGLIAGIDRQTSLADGLNITSESDLMIKSMTITADNKISVGNNTITLNDVTIKLSQTTYELVEGIYYFNLLDLFHCSVDMADVTFDASDLTLPEGFNPETNGISFNLGDAKLTTESIGRDINLLMGGYGSQTMSIDEQGRPVFTKLVETPEPTTGTLSMLALAALASRRRRK